MQRYNEDMKNSNDIKLPIDEYQLLQYVLSSSRQKSIAYILKRLEKLKKMVLQNG